MSGFNLSSVQNSDSRLHACLSICNCQLCSALVNEFHPHIVPERKLNAMTRTCQLLVKCLAMARPPCSTSLTSIDISCSSTVRPLSMPGCLHASSTSFHGLQQAALSTDDLVNMSCLLLDREYSKQDHHLLLAILVRDSWLVETHASLITLGVSKCWTMPGSQFMM